MTKPSTVQLVDALVRNANFGLRRSPELELEAIDEIALGVNGLVRTSAIVALLGHERYRARTADDDRLREAVRYIATCRPGEKASLQEVREQASKLSGVPMGCVGAAERVAAWAGADIEREPGKTKNAVSVSVQFPIPGEHAYRGLTGDEIEQVHAEKGWPDTVER